MHGIRYRKADLDAWVDKQVKKTEPPTENKVQSVPICKWKMVKELRRVKPFYVFRQYIDFSI